MGGARETVLGGWDLPVLPEVAVKVLQRVRDPEATAAELEGWIVRDPALAARVLRMANSAFFHLRQHVATVQRAVVVMGFNTIRSVVMAAATRRLWQAQASGLEDRLMWEHSLAVALGSRRIAEAVGLHVVEEAFIAGLLHDVGKMCMGANLGERYRQVVRRVIDRGALWTETERELFGFDHAEVGALVLERWSFPLELQEAVRRHHHPDAATVEREFCAAVGLANDLCVQMGIGPEKRPGLEIASGPAARILKLDEDRLSGLREEIGRVVEREKELLELS